LRAVSRSGVSPQPPDRRSQRSGVSRLGEAGRFDQLGERADAACHYRQAGCHCLGGGHAERLG
jgi:hypothetical protein